MSASIVASKSEEQFYQRLVEVGYPEDRIAREYQLDDYRADFAILPPGLAQEPMAVIEVKNNRRSAMEWIGSPRAVRLQKSFSFPVYVYGAAEKVLLDADTKGAIKAQSLLPDYDFLKQNWLKRRPFFSQLKLENFMAFKSAVFQFGSKLNVIIGENGSGKTQLLKLLYSMARSFVYLPDCGTVKLDYSRFNIMEIFRATKYMDFITSSPNDSTSFARIQFALNGQKKSESFSFRENVIVSSTNALKTQAFSRYDNGTAVFLPTHELLSIFPGFSSLQQIYRDKWAFDQTYSDCIAYLGLPTIKSQELFSNSIIKEVEKAIHGHIYLNEQGTRFLMQMEKSKAIYEIPMVAEGWRKLGQLLQLMSIGAIHPGSIMLWDEPEANLNPQLIRLLAKVIVLLAKMDIQIFVTTHNLFFLRELNMLTKSKKKGNAEFEKGDIRYFNFLGKGKVEQGDDEIELGNVLLLEESLKQSDRYLLEDF